MTKRNERAEQDVLAVLARRAYENARDHGFWSDEDHLMNTQELLAKIALMHSELSEALEAIRDGHLHVTYREDGKPEGLLPELADCAIRIFDLVGAICREEAFARVLLEKMRYNTSRPFLHGKRA